MFLIYLILIICSHTIVYGENWYLIDLEPAKARQLINNRIVPSKPTYANLVREDVPVIRSVDGKQVELKEDIYQTSQAHGQDGEGSYGYMYSNPFDAKVETRDSNGVVQGEYRYLSPNGGEVSVKYFADENGVRFTDNLNHESVKDTDDVRLAKIQHEKAVQDAINRIQNARIAHQKQQQLQSKKQHQTYEIKEFKEYKSEPVGEFSETSETKAKNPDYLDEVSYVPRGFYYDFSNSLKSLSDESYAKLKSL